MQHDKKTETHSITEQVEKTYTQSLVSIIFNERGMCLLTNRIQRLFI
jgi:hypothetical protein